MQPLWKTVWRFLKELKIELPYHPAIALLVIYLRDTGVLFRRGTCTSMFIAALSTIAKIWTEPKCPSMDERIKKMWCVCVCVCMYTHTYIYIYTYIMEYYSAIKRRNLAICNNEDGTRVYMLSEIRERQIS